MAEDPSFYFNPFSPSWFGWTWRKVIPRVPIFVESRVSLRQRGQLDIPFQAFYPCIAFTSPSDGRSLLDDDKSVSRKSRFTVFFSPPWRYLFLWIWHIEPEPKIELATLKERGSLSSFYKREVQSIQSEYFNIQRKLVCWNCQFNQRLIYSLLCRIDSSKSCLKSLIFAFEKNHFNYLASLRGITIFLFYIVYRWL